MFCFAFSADVKLPGAERRSLYYRRFGNPNYGGMTGILSRSYRRRVRISRIKSSNDPNGDSRHIESLSAQFAELVANAYDDPDSVVSQIVGNSNYNIWNSTSQAPAPERPLIVYDNLYDESDQVAHPAIFPKYTTKSNTRQRRNASGKIPKCFFFFLSICYMNLCRELMGQYSKLCLPFPLRSSFPSTL